MLREDIVDGDVARRKLRELLSGELLLSFVSYEATGIVEAMQDYILVRHI